MYLGLKTCVISVRNEQNGHLQNLHKS
uniref:Uncharacterized protein n=1 Tax=Rhizophora mucronata TaxID=61149 RepID=A0A2P2M8W8_RHIMU